MLERLTWDQGKIVKDEIVQIWNIFKFDEIVGAYLGKETKYVVKESGGTIHGHPISEKEAKEYLKNAD